MGGWGSGRRISAKDTTSNYRALDVRRLQRDGLLTPGRACGLQWTRSGVEVASIQVQTGADRVTLSYRSRSHGGEWQAMEYSVSLQWTDCNFGKQRAWFLCPAQGCGRRVAILYGGAIFACRHCHRLAYACQRETPDDRAARRADTIRRRLGWKEGILNPIGGKPKGMHWRTYERLIREHNAFLDVALTGMAMRLEIINRQLAALSDDLTSAG